MIAYPCICHQARVHAVSAYPPICIVHAAYKGSFPLAYAPPGAGWDYSNAGFAMGAPAIG